MKLGQEILSLLGRRDYQPLNAAGIGKALGLKADQGRALREALRNLERQGGVARIRKECFVLPKTADLVTGIVLVSPGGRARLVVDPAGDSGAEEWRIPTVHLGVALHRDRVVARRLQRVRAPRGAREKPLQREVEVIRILERANATVVGTLRQTRGFFHVEPDDPRLIHDIYLREERKKEALKVRVGDKVVVQLDPWENPQRSPEGVLLERLGSAEDPGVGLLSIQKRHHLPMEFPRAVEREAESIPEEVLEADWRGREDYRGQPALTIDPDDAKDFDDAVHVELDPAGGWRLSVHIADVGHYVRRGSELDREARVRGNSTYLVDRVIPMLPERLSNGICSLKPGVERLAFSAFLDFNAQGKLRRSRFARTVISSVARLTYRQALAVLEGNWEGRTDLGKAVPGSLPYSNRMVVERVRAAWELAAVLRRNRFAQGSLDLDFPEVKVWLDSKGRPERLERVENDPSHQLIEEFMLAANEAVAAALKRSKAPTVYRVHEMPDPDRLQEFREKARECGFRAGDLTMRREVEKLLKAIRGRPEEYALKLDFLKSLKRATYSVRPLGHYGLAKVNYTHFTSPIRRYADLLVHRALAGSTASKAGEIEAAAQHVSETERRSAEAEKDSVQLKKMEFFERQLAARESGRAQRFRAVVVEVRGHGLVVELPEALMTGLVHVSALPGDFYVLDAVRGCFRGKRTRRRFGLGQELQVEVCRVDPRKRQLDFALVEE